MLDVGLPPHSVQCLNARTGRSGKSPLTKLPGNGHPATHQPRPRPEPHLVSVHAPFNSVPRRLLESLHWPSPPLDRQRLADPNRQWMRRMPRECAHPASFLAPQPFLRSSRRKGVLLKRLRVRARLSERAARGRDALIHFGLRTSDFGLPVKPDRLSRPGRQRAGFIEYDRLDLRHAFEDKAILEKHLDPGQQPLRGAQGEGCCQRQRAGARHDQHGDKRLHRPRRVPLRQPEDARTDSNHDYAQREPAADAVGQCVEGALAILPECFVVPQRDQVALRHRFDRLDLDHPPHLPPPRVKVIPRRLGHRFRLPRHKAVINARRTAHQARVSGNQLAVPEQHPVSHTQVRDGHALLTPRRFARDGQREEALEVAIERHSVIRLLLEHPAAEQEEHQPRQ